MLTPETLSAIVAGYLECAAWADAPEGSTARFTREAMETARADCAAFVDACGPLAAEAIGRDGYSPARFGHDYWLSRCGHGTGFWDRDELEAPPACDVPPMVDRDGKTYANTRGESLGDTLTAIAYGTDAAISRFASFGSLSAYRGWLHFD